MSDQSEQAISQLIGEIEILKQQKADIIAQYGEDVKKLDAEVKELQFNKESLLVDLKSIASAKQEAKNIIESAERTANAIYNAANSEKAKIEKKADEEAQRIILDAKSIMAEAEGYMVQARESKANGARFEVEMRDALQEAQDMKADAGIVSSKLRDREQKLNSEYLKLDSLVTTLNQKEVRLEEKQAVLELNEGSVKEKEKILSNKIAELDEAIKKHQEKYSELEERDSNFKKTIEHFNMEKSALMESLAKTKEVNEWRSKELDLGFEKLKNDQATLKVEQNKLKSIQKELQK